MSGFGFVYILVNDYMPDVYKVGCTERSPHARADELSKPTGVPAPFRVHCYVEVRDFQAVERDMHKWLAGYRISDNREFFAGGLEFACRCLYWMPGRLSFSYPCHPSSDGGTGGIDGIKTNDEDSTCWADTVNPFHKPAPVEPPAEIAAPELKLVRAAGGLE